MSSPDPLPTIGRICHYRSLGSADGRYPSVCRAAIITEVEQSHANYDQVFASLAVLNPTGLFFDRSRVYDRELHAGTWHWYSDCEEPES